MMYMDVEKGYRNLLQNPDMSYWFLFRWKGSYFQCVALPFGCGRSPLWFNLLMVSFFKEFRGRG